MVNVHTEQAPPLARRGASARSTKQSGGTSAADVDAAEGRLYVSLVNSGTSTTLTYARAQMEVSLGFHMIFAALGIAMPLLMVIAEARHLAGHGAHFRDLARTWGKATALLFAVGAVSGTALSFELGLLWPRLMQMAGPAIGPAFVVEGYAFFVEAIFVGLYLYGWDRLTPKQHLACGIPVAVSGLVSGILVVAANAWMQFPSAFTLDASGAVIPTSMWTAFSSPMWLAMSVHSSLSCYASVGFAVAGVYALAILRQERAGLAPRSAASRSPLYLRSALRIALAVGGGALALQMVSGDFMAKEDAALQPGKLAAMEAHFTTARGAPLLIGGWPDAETREVQGAIAIPKMLSFLAHDDFNAEVTGLDRVPRDEWPNVQICHLAFDTMVGTGSLLLGLTALFYLENWRAKKKRQRDGLSRASEPDTSFWMLRALVLASPLGFVALEAGWVVTEAGRQPWVLRGLLRTADAVTTAPGVPLTFYGFGFLYICLGAALVALLRAISHVSR